jgi:hypothetical protein
MDGNTEKERPVNGAGHKIVTRLNDMQKWLLESGSKFANHAAAVAKAAALYQEMKCTINNAEAIEKALLEHAGIERSESHAFVMVPIDDSTMDLFTSACGHDDAVVFSYPKIKSFLKANGVRAIIGIVHEPENTDTYDRNGHYNAVPLSAVAMPDVFSKGPAFEALVAECGGSFRHEKLKGAPGWAVFESE